MCGPEVLVKCLTQHSSAGSVPQVRRLGCRSRSSPVTPALPATTQVQIKSGAAARAWRGFWDTLSELHVSVCIEGHVSIVSGELGLGATQGHRGTGLMTVILSQWQSCFFKCLFWSMGRAEGQAAGADQHSWVWCASENPAQLLMASTTCCLVLLDLGVRCRPAVSFCSAICSSPDRHKQQNCPRQ